MCILAEAGNKPVYFRELQYSKYSNDSNVSPVQLFHLHLIIGLESELEISLVRVPTVNKIIATLEYYNIYFNGDRYETFSLKRKQNSVTW